MSAAHVGKPGKGVGPVVDKSTLHKATLEIFSKPNLSGGPGLGYGAGADALDVVAKT